MALDNGNYYWHAAKYRVSERRAGNQTTSRILRKDASSFASGLVIKQCIGYRLALSQGC